MGEQPPFAGLGKLYFCRVEDKDKEPVPLGEAVTLEREPGRMPRKMKKAVSASYRRDTNGR